MKFSCKKGLQRLENLSIYKIEISIYYKNKEKKNEMNSVFIFVFGLELFTNLCYNF